MVMLKMGLKVIYICEIIYIHTVYMKQIRGEGNVGVAEMELVNNSTINGCIGLGFNNFLVY